MNAPDTSLAGEDRLAVAARLLATMIAAGLLAGAALQRMLGPATQAPIAELVMAASAVLAAAPVFLTAVAGFVRRDPATLVDQLVLLAVLAAMVSGEYATAVLVPLFMDIGHFLEQRSVLGTQAAIDGLKVLHARAARRVRGTVEEEVAPDALVAGDVLRIRPGELVAADGIVIAGRSCLETATVTGESEPVEAGPGDRVFGGCLNVSGLLEVKVTEVGRESTLGRVLELLGEAARSRTPVVKMLERYAGYYVPVILAVAAMVLFATHDVSRAISVLVVGCPGAFVLAGPTAMVAALAAGSRLGILIKSTKFLEALADVNAVVVDKTGTVTLGKLEVCGSHPLEGVPEGHLLEAAAACAAGSKHPVAQAVAKLARERGLSAEAPGEVTEVPGCGVEVPHASGPLRMGRASWLTGLGLAVPEPPAHDGSVVWISLGDRVLGALLFSDTLRPDAREAIDRLRGLSIHRILLVTGDRAVVARRVADALGIDAVVADALPEGKLAAVRAEKREGRSVMVVGDGVNDALALAHGDVGIAMGALGSDIAIRSADVALMSDDLRRLASAVALARRARDTIHQNVLVGAGSSVCMLALAAAGILPPLAGALLHNVGELFVLFNSARLVEFRD